jgi:hypothetical protein
VSLRIGRGWFLFLFITFPIVLFGGNKARQKRKRKESALNTEHRKICKNFWGRLFSEKFKWKVKMEAQSGSTRSTRVTTKKQRNKLEGLKVEWYEDFTPMIVASVALKTGKRAKKYFVYPEIEAFHRYKDEGLEVEQLVFGGPVAIKLDDKGQASIYPKVWPTKFEVFTSVQKKKLKYLSRKAVQINPFLVLPAEVLSSK